MDRHRTAWPLWTADGWSWWLQQPSWLSSLLVHLVLLLMLGLLVVPLPSPRPVLTLSFATQDEPTAALDTLQLTPPEPAGAAPAPPPLEITPATEPTPIALPEVTELALPVVSEATVTPAATGAVVTGPVSHGSPGGLTGREGRRGQAEHLGATPASEAAVDRALVWLAAHQENSGRWTFDLKGCGCDGQCSHPGGAFRATNGSTALALLPFLGAGQTHEHGYHRRTVEAGMRYLLGQQQRDGSFYEPQGTFYSHGLATLVLCEALAMTDTDPGVTGNRYRKQPKLRAAAQKAVNFLVDSQHSGGGWRYAPKQPGDTSVVGWQAMALQSAKLAKLRVPKRTLDGTADFLDSVQGDDYGGQYGYQTRGNRPGTNAIGLLCRMYSGWDRNHPGIMAGADLLHGIGPSTNNVYYNYYATQVLHHYQGPYWDEWHPALRDYLVESQALAGHESGSWYFDGDFGSTSGGRLYVTAMSAMVLEVYYRHMPIYSQQAVPTDAGWLKDKQATEAAEATNGAELRAEWAEPDSERP